jgi:UDP-N-acetylglucosamine--N-acetylmuramyl-(pentapeptide) pyrophosphoryl-undecaprenol N-acetylglucosamine transferase
MPNLAVASELQSYCGSDGGSSSGSNGGIKTTTGATKRSGEPQSAAGSHKGGVEILYVGSKSELDRKLVEASGLKFKSIYTGKLRRYFSFRNFVDPLLVIAGFFQSLWIVISFWPDVVFAKGGFVSLPVAFAAFLLRRPVVLHESDRVMGLSNRIVARLATKICVAFPDVQIAKEPKVQISKVPNIQSAKRPNSKIVFTGSPVRKFIKDGKPEIGYKITGLSPQKPIILIWGGSQGALEINKMAEESFHDLKSKFQMIHITGYGKKTSISDPGYVQFEYLGDDLKHIYSITDVVVGRSGANSLYELALMRKPNILIPLKTSAHNHQQLNAEYFEQMGASIILRDNSLSETIKALWHSPEQIDLMKEALGRVSVPDAAGKIAELLLNI